MQPPGTGKTRTIIETVKLLKAHFEVPQPLMICTYTNVAVDNLVEGLMKAGLKPLRVGFGGKVSMKPEELQRFSSIQAQRAGQTLARNPSRTANA